MRAFQKTYRDRHGAEQVCENFTVEVRGTNGEPLRFTACPDEGLSLALGNKIAGIIRHRALNEPLSVELVRFVESAPKKLIDRLLELGILEQRQSQSGKPLSEFIAEFIAGRRAAGRAAFYVKDLEKRLSDLFAKIGVRFWSEIDTQKIETFLADVLSSGKSARTYNAYLIAFKIFHNWLLDRELISRPLPGLRRIDSLDENQNRRHVRRSMTLDELGRLFEVAKTRPLLERQKIRRGKSKGLFGSRMTPETAEKLNLFGLERSLVYKTAFCTGLRRNELASLTVRDAVLNASPAFLTLAAKNEKARRGASLPIRSDLAAEIRAFISRTGRKAADPLFVIPTLRTFKADCEAAGIEIKNDDGKSVDFHGLRMSFATHLSKSGCSPRTAQAALRHSDIRLTMQVYTDPTLLDVSGAIERLPMPGTVQAKKVKRA